MYRQKSFGVVLLLVATLSAGAAVLGLVWRRRRRPRETRKRRVGLCPTSVLVVSCEAEWDQAFSLLTDQLLQDKVLGFDCEWVSALGAPRPVSLLQLASTRALCVLVRLHLLTALPHSLHTLLADQSVIKVGVACVEDARRLLHDHGLECRGCVDLRHLALRSTLNLAHGGLGLKSLALSVLGENMDKDVHLRRSNWESPILSARQVQYAAIDALAAVRIFTALRIEQCDQSECDQRTCDQRTCNQSADSEDQESNPAACDTFTSQWTQQLKVLIDLPYTGKTSNKVKSGSKSRAAVNSPPSGAAAAKLLHRAYVVRKTPLYHNCQLRSPDGQLLCTCDVKKANWYLTRGLADKTSDDPLTVQLRFEPAGRPLDERNYYLMEKDNVCVVCGKDESYIKKCVIPHEYRKHFPPLMKEHKSHDVLLLCTTCHQRSGVHDAHLRQTYTARLAATQPLTPDRERAAAPPTGEGSDSAALFYIGSVRSAAKALLSSGQSKIPVERLDELRQIVLDYFGCTEITDDVLQQALNLCVKPGCQRGAGSAPVDHGQRVVQLVLQQEGLVEFERIWRQHFLDTMRPAHLPPLWSVDHSHDELSALSSRIQQAVALD